METFIFPVVLQNIFFCYQFADILYSTKGKPASAKGLGVPEDGGENSELAEQARGLPLHGGEGHGLLLHLRRVLGGGGPEVPKVEI